MASNTPLFAEGENAEQLTSDTEELRQQGWALDDKRTGVSKTFHFKSYFKAVSFLVTIASESSVKKHHPTMTVDIGTVYVHWTTHRPLGLTLKDISMARFCDDGAELMGAVECGQGLNCDRSGTEKSSKA
ncbi:Transcriptional coactivator/pterin dehydratase [Penicillium samsonianum]|uniref:Transcriptional coactivator/pterin dehydratase n=1 Tax=Penicillium samsonianum TaxID=1882272 RepID=UPI002546C092|nr:Transcriptional coactivator/pterin dehydratase [Penicillium samsonianum]KAJ6126186.1 Transcriptional coactivator/pterin dehydratase [Penicillium samsonianum]